MKAQEIINEIISGRNVSKASIARQLGISPQSLNSRLFDTDDMRIGSVIGISDVIGYDLVLVPKGSKLPMNSYVIDDSSQSFSAI